MGLDGVELVLAFEERFGVSISDAEAEACVTPAMAIDVIFAKLRSTDERVCISQRAFYLLRKAAMDVLGLPRSAVVPEADLRSMVGDKSHEAVWRSLKARLQVRSWPRMERPGWMNSVIGGASLLVLCLGFWRFHWAAAVAGAILLATVAERFTRRFRGCIPPRRAGFRDLVPYAMTSDLISWRREQVAVLVRGIVIDQLGLREGQYREDAHFTRDLGMN
jgi:hypothetical protein